MTDVRNQSKEYLENIKLLVEEKKKLQKQKIGVSTVSLQVTVCKRIGEVPDILRLLKKSVLIELSGTKLFLSGTKDSFKRISIGWMKGSVFEE